MARGDSIVRRLDAALRKVGPPDRTVYKRTVTRSGGDVLIGRPGVVTQADAIFDPQPVVARSGEESGVVLAGGKSLPKDGYVCLFSPTAISLSDLQSTSLFIVFKDGSGNEEVFRVHDYETASVNGRLVSFTVFIRSVAR